MTNMLRELYFGDIDSEFMPETDMNIPERNREIINALKEVKNRYEVYTNKRLKYAIDDAIHAIRDSKIEKWEMTGSQYLPYKCTGCGRFERMRTRYCPDCGAQMEWWTE